MQIMGVYRNCICYAGANHWYNLTKINPAVNLASDTQGARHSARYWLYSGTLAAVFMAMNCYFGWWYQKLIRHRFTEAVKDMYTSQGTRTQSTSVTPRVNDDHTTPLLASESTTDDDTGAVGGEESYINSGPMARAKGEAANLSRNVVPMDTTIDGIRRLLELNQAASHNAPSIIIGNDGVPRIKTPSG